LWQMPVPPPCSYEFTLQNGESDMAERREQQALAVSQVPQDANETTIDLMELAYRLLGKWKMITCVALAFAIAFGAYTFLFITPLYKATSTIYVLNRRDTAINMSDLQIGAALTYDYIKVFDMWEVHEQVISNLNLPYSYKEIGNMLTVVNDSNTRMLDITVTSPDPQEAATIAHEYAIVASQYIADTMATDKPSIMSVPLVPANPVSPNKTKNIIIGFMLGAVLAAGIVTVQTIMDDKYKTAEDIRQYTGMVTLAAIPLEDGKKKKKAAKYVGRAL